MFFIAVSLSLLSVLILIILSIGAYFKLTCGICKCSRHMVGKVVVVTGGNAGIGYETARDLADRGARVILACRSESRGTTARDDIIRLTGNSDVHFRELDLASLRSVRTFADSILKTEKRLDILINNAGIYDVENKKTEDGLLLAMQINHFGPFLLTSLLLPLLKTSAPSRIINVSSMAHAHGKIDFQNLNTEKQTNKSFDKLQVYSNTKLCNVLMTVELDRILKGSGVTANSLHPGLVYTQILYTAQSGGLQYVKMFGQYFSKSPWEGAQTTIFLAVSPEVSSLSGRYFADCREQSTSKLAQDTEVARKLWEVSERLVNLK